MSMFTTLSRSMRNLCIATVAVLLGVAAAPVAASGGNELRLEPVPSARLDQESLQRGARVFANYCLSCHSAKYMRYNRLTDIGLTEAQIRDNLMFASDKIGDTMAVAMPVREAKGWFGTVPPDLSVETRVRGTEWLYNYFLSFYRDDSAPSGWNNLVFQNVAMPHVLWTAGGVNKLVVREFESHEQAKGAALATRGVSMIAPAAGHKMELRSLETETAGTMKPEEYRAMVADLVNFMDYMSEPARNKRIQLGLVVLIYLGILFLFVYWMKREYWSDVH